MINYDKLDPLEFGLSKRLVIVKLDDNTIGIVKKRKSRIVMTDGHQIKDFADAIRLIYPSKTIVLIHSGPVCSKTKKFLSEYDIELKHEE